MIWHRALLIQSLVALSIAAEPSPPPASPIVFPKKVKPDVAPAPLPDAPYTLGADSLFVVDCKTDCVLRVHPANLVAVKKLVGPVTIYSKFSDGSGKLELRTFAGPTVFAVTAAGTGTVSLDVIPVGFKTDAEIQTAMIQVDSGQGPQPPPGPGPGPGPAPAPAPVVVKTFRVIFVVESGKNLTAEQNGVVYGRLVEEYLTKNVTGGKAGFKRRDPNTPSEPGVMGDLWTAAKAKLKPTDPPCVIVEKNSSVEIIPLAATPEAMIAAFDEYLKGAK